MKKLFTTILFIALSLSARDNPFFPSKGETDILLTSNAKEDMQPLKRVALSFPSTARTIQSITIKYKNLDGSVETKVEKINNSIDWHIPLFISQNINASSETVKKVKKEKFQKVFSMKFLKLYASKQRFKILTQDKLLRNFLLTKPHRIVCDFKREIDIRSYEKGIMQGKVKSVRVGKHKGYYRVVIELDGYYRYKLLRIKDGYTFTLL